MFTNLYFTHQHHISSPVSSTITTNEPFKVIARTPVITNISPNLMSNTLIPITADEIQNIDAPLRLKKIPNNQRGMG